MFIELTDAEKEPQLLNINAISSIRVVPADEEFGLDQFAGYLMIEMTNGTVEFFKEDYAEVAQIIKAQ